MKFIAIVPFILALTGCPGGSHEGAELGASRWISVDKDRVCFSLDRHDLLSRYYLESNEQNQTVILASPARKPVSLAYPNSCFTVNLATGFQYGALYTLNGQRYHYEFLIDNNGNVVRQ